MVVLVLATVAAGALLSSRRSSGGAPHAPTPSGIPVAAEYEGTVRAVLSEGLRELPMQTGAERYQLLSVEIRTGDRRGQTVTAESTQLVSGSASRYGSGDAVVVQVGATPDMEQWVVIDAVRRPALYWLAAAFAAAVMVVGGRRGVAALLGLGISFAVLAVYVLPRLIAGDNPVAVSVGGASAIIGVTLYLTHGVSRKTTVAVAGIAISLLLTGLLSAAYIGVARLTGRTEEAMYLQLALPGTPLNLQGLLLGGVIIGALGVLDDAAIAQAAIVFALRDANPALDWRELYRRGLVVGRDHIGSLVNTLALAYAGTALPLLLLFSTNNVPFAVALNRELVASEVARTLLGSLGLVAAVPITTALAALAARQPLSGSIGQDRVQVEDEQEGHQIRGN